MGGRDGELSFFGKISKTLPLCGLLWGTRADSAHSWIGDKVDGGEFPVAGDADGGGLRSATYLGGWAWNGNLFMGVFEKNWGGCFLKLATVNCPFGK
jgi:hypothetical protein